VEFVSGPVKAFAQRLRATPEKHIRMMGGGGLIASFLDAGEIDEFDIHVIPTLIGEGIPLVAPRHRNVLLRLRSARKYRRRRLTALQGRESPMEGVVQHPEFDVIPATLIVKRRNR
jgi:dihydrofolate reductase